MVTTNLGTSMKALFVELPAFERYRASYLTDDEFRSFQLMLLKNPLCGDVIQHTGGLRKVRFSDSKRNKGKRGGTRIIYYWYLEKSQFLLFTIYGKNIADDLTTSQREQLSKMLEMIKKRGMMTKRDIFSELQEGMEAWSEFNEGKKTLKTHRIDMKPLSMTPTEVKAIREKLKLSQAVFAQYLHTGVTTLQNWEQGLAKPNKQAVLLLKMVEKRPDTLNELAGFY